MRVNLSMIHKIQRKKNQIASLQNNEQLMSAYAYAISFHMLNSSRGFSVHKSQYSTKWVVLGVSGMFPQQKEEIRFEFESECECAMCVSRFGEWFHTCEFTVVSYPKCTSSAFTTLLEF